MSATATAAANLVHQIVPLLRPQILLSLFVRPGTGASNWLEIAKNALLPLFEALGVHVLARRAVLVAANYANGVVQLVAVDETEVECVVLETLTGGHTATERLQIDSGAGRYRVGAVASRCHEQERMLIHFNASGIASVRESFPKNIL